MKATEKIIIVSLAIKKLGVRKEKNQELLLNVLRVGNKLSKNELFHQILY
jgi:hypothetical protein